MEDSNLPRLTIGNIMSNGVAIGLRNALSLIAALVLWVLTIWIPYLNVGSSIGLVASIIAMSKGGIMSPLEIFDSKYRRYMGEFFLLMGLRNIGIFTGLLFLFFPGIVIALAWSQALYLLIDKRMNPIDALKTSNDITYGHKWTIFFGIFFLVLIFQLVLGSLMYFVLMDMNRFICGLIVAVLFMVFIPVMFGARAHIYGILSRNVQERV